MTKILSVFMTGMFIVVGRVHINGKYKVKHARLTNSYFMGLNIDLDIYTYKDKLWISATILNKKLCLLKMFFIQAT